MFNLYKRISNYENDELFVKIRNYQITNIALIVSFILSRYINRVLHAGSCIPHKFTLNSIVACGTTLSFIVQGLGFIFLIILMIKGINGIKLSKTAKERFPEMNFLLLKMTSYLLMIPLILQFIPFILIFTIPIRGNL